MAQASGVFTKTRLCEVLCMGKAHRPLTTLLPTERLLLFSPLTGEQTQGSKLAQDLRAKG